MHIKQKSSCTTKKLGSPLTGEKTLAPVRRRAFVGLQGASVAASIHCAPLVERASVAAPSHCPPLVERALVAAPPLAPVTEASDQDMECAPQSGCVELPASPCSWPDTDVECQDVCIESACRSPVASAKEMAASSPMNRSLGGFLTSPLSVELQAALDRQAADDTTCLSPGNVTPKDSSETACPDDFLVDDNSWHSHVIYPALSREEGDVVPATSASDLCKQPWQRIVKWIALAHRRTYAFGHAESLFLAVQLAGRFMTARPPELRWKLLAAASLSLACKFELQTRYPWGAELVPSDTAMPIRSDDVHRMEISVLEALRYRLHFPTAAHHIRWFTEVTGGDEAKHKVALYVAELGLSDPRCLRWSASCYAMAAVMLSNWLAGRETVLQLPLQHSCVAHVASKIGEITDISETLKSALFLSAQGELAYDKYAGDPERVSQRAAKLLSERSGQQRIHSRCHCSAC